jgi:hypothetical protein
MPVSSEERTRQVIQEQARRKREHLQAVGARNIPSQEALEREQAELCRRQDRRHDEKKGR